MDSNGIIKEVQQGILNTPDDIRGQYSDGYHSYDELYEFRKIYNAMAFKLLYEQDRLTHIFRRNTFVHKSWKHADGEWCFGKEKEWFIVAAQLPVYDGGVIVDYEIITNHYKAEDWYLFLIPEMEISIFEYDGHTPQDVVTRITNFIKR